MPVEEALAPPRVHVEEPYLHCEGGHDRTRSTGSSRSGYEVVRWRRRTSTSAARRRSRCSPTARSRRPATRGAAATGSSSSDDVDGRRDPPGRAARRGGARRARPRGRLRARGLADHDRRLAQGGRGAPLPERRSGATAHAAVYVAETDGRPIVGRLSLARDPHPGEPHVADLGLMVARRTGGSGIGRALLAGGRALGARARASRSSSCTSSRTTRRRSRSTRRSASTARATATALPRAVTATSTRS